MQYCICASGCRTSTTNLRILRDEHEKTGKKTQTVFHYSGGDPRNRPVYDIGRLDRHVAVELAAAAAARLETDHLLAGTRPAGPVPNPLWRFRRTPFHALQHAMA